MDKHAEVVAARINARALVGFLSVFLAQASAAFAFPFIDQTNQDTVPGAAPLGTELPATDVTGLRNQLRLVNPAAAGNPSAWTIIPRLTIQEMFTDNALELTSPRVADAVTVVAPGISVLADTARLKLNLDYQPNLLLHAVNGPLNVITQQLNATGVITVVPDFVFVDIRALSGVQSRLGALAGAGTLGAPNAALTPTTGGATADTGQGLNRQNEVQTSTFGISPYLLRQLGDYGSVKLGVSVDASRYSTINGFATSPFPTGGGANGSSLLTTEETAHYATGEFMEKLQYALDIDVSQMRTQQDPSSFTVGSITTTTPGANFNSERQTINNQLTYALNRHLTLLVSAGEQRITYGGGNAPGISGLIWNAGFTYTPGPDSSVTITYGHQDGANSLMANGHIAVGGRSLVSFNYSNTVGTQLENLQNQFNNAAIGALGGLVNAQTGGPALIATNALGVQNGVFRFNTFNASWTTSWLRDTFQATFTWSEQTSITPTLGGLAFDPVTNTITLVPASAAGPSTDVWTAGVSWQHELSPDMILSTSASYSFIHRTGGLDDNSVSAAVGLQYTLSPSTSLSARYSFFDRTSKIPGYSIYENILLLGVTKQF